MTFSLEFNSLETYRKKYRGETIVIKFGGALAESDAIVKSIAKQVDHLVNDLGIHIVVVHGGGNQINNALERQGLSINKDDKTGIRKTDISSLGVIDGCLRSLNSHLVKQFHQASNNLVAIGMAGYDYSSVIANVSSDYTGHVNGVDTTYFNRLFARESANITPIIYPICKNANSTTPEHRLNVNADNVAAMIASKMGARRLLLCSDVPGVLNLDKKIIRGISTDQVPDLIENGTVTDGMVEKLKSASKAAEQMHDSGGVVILDGRQEYEILKEILTDEGAGTLIRTPDRIQDPKHPELTVRL